MLAPSFHDHQPITWIKRLPVYLTTILVALFATGMIVTTILESAGIPTYPLIFSVGGFWRRGFFWSPITSVLVDHPKFFFLFCMLFFYTSAVEVEKYLGRARFLKLLTIFLIIPPIVLTLLWKTLGPRAVTDYFTSYHMTVGMFIAFATLYPNVEWFGWVPMKWVAFVGLALVALGCLPDRDWANLSLHAAMTGSAFGYIRFLKAGGSVPLPDLRHLFRRKPKLRVLPPPPPRTRSRVADDDDAVESIDPLLEKIAKTGMSSLTAKERAKLEKARQALMKKETPRR